LFELPNLVGAASFFPIFLCVADQTFRLCIFLGRARNNGKCQQWMDCSGVYCVSWYHVSAAGNEEQYFDLLAFVSNDCNG